ncbi:MAG TPA: hypothetical protein VK148_09085 [Xanthobacteraceae bacterium]|nr:hypothetical protein [Xanthobacteraceae bacterium]
MGAARKEFELPVDGLLKYLPREARLGFAASLDVSENNVDKLPEPEEAPALPRLRVGKELIANDVGEARHPRSLIPERISIPQGHESSVWIGQTIGLAVATAIGAAAGVGGFYWTFASPATQIAPARTAARIIATAPAQVLATSTDSRDTVPTANPDARAETIVPVPVSEGDQAAQFPKSELSVVPLPRQIDSAQIVLMLKSGAAFLANGNVGAARMMLQPAAEAGDPAAAFALAETYDPVVLGRLGVKGGISPDIAQARKWYAKSKELGSPQDLARQDLGRQDLGRQDLESGKVLGSARAHQ